MYLQQVEVVVREGREAAFETALLEVRRRVFSVPGYRGLAVAESAEDPGTYLVQVRWETRDELAAFAGSSAMERAWEPVAPYLAAAPRVTHYVERDGLSFQGPGVVTDLTWRSG